MKNLFNWIHKSQIILTVFISLSTLLIIFTILVYNYRKAEYKKNVISELQTIGDLKASEISTWLNERIADASLLSQPSFLSRRLESYLEKKSLEDSVNLQQKLLIAKINYNYLDIFIVDENGKILIGTNKDISSISESSKKFLYKFLNSGKKIFFDIYYCSDHQYLLLDFATPIISNDGRKILGYLILRADPNAYLYPTLNRWPILSQTAEVVLVKVENDSVVLLNNIRNKPNSALQIRFPLSNKDVVAVKVANNILGIVEGYDYRHVKVLAYALKLPNTPWLVIAKADTEEIFHPMHIQLTILIVILTLLILLLGVIFLLIANTYQKSYIKKLYDSELEKKALISHFEYLIKNANDIIILADSQGRVIEANNAALKAYQLNIDDLTSLNIVTLGEFKFYSKGRRGNVSPGPYEAIHKRADGTKFPVEINEQTIKIGDTRYYQAIIRDITERKQAEERLLNRERVLKLFVDHAPAAIAMYDTEMRYMACSKRFLIDYGLQDTDVIGRSHYEIFPDIPQRWKDIHRRCLTGATDSAEQDPFPRADGSLD